MHSDEEQQPRDFFPGLALADVKTFLNMTCWFDQHDLVGGQCSLFTTLLAF